MKEHYPAVERDNKKSSPSLADRMDPAIGEASTVMGAMLSELLRRTLRGGVLQVDNELHEFVADRVEATIRERAPAVEQAAVEAAEIAARTAATEVAYEEVKVLEERTKEADRALTRQVQEADRELARQIEDAARKAREDADRVARNLGGRIDTVGKDAEQAVARTARTLTDRIEETHKSAQDTTQETAQRLAREIAEAERRAEEKTRTEVAQQILEFQLRTREGTVLLKNQLKSIEDALGLLGKQLTDEQAARHTEQASARRDWEQGERERRAAEEAHRQELARLREDGQAALRDEVDKLLQTNSALAARVAELEKPRGLRALFIRLFGRKS